MRTIILVIALCLATTSMIGGPALAAPEHHGPPEGKGGFDLGMPCNKMFQQNFFLPELIMRHQQEIGLTAEQKTYMKTQIQEAESAFTGLEWDLHEAISNLAALAQQQTVDEKQVLSQLDKVLDLENKIKRSRLALMIRLKNRLTPEQQAQLQEVKSRHHGMQGKGGCMKKEKCPMQGTMEKGPGPMGRDEAPPAAK